MLKDQLQVYSLSLVFAGNFNPVLFQPFWLAGKKLIRDQEAELANIELIHNELVRYEIGGWLNLEINKARFELRTNQVPYFDIVKDLAAGIFEIIKDTPCNAFGINHLMHYSLKDQETYYNFGNKLAPLSNWSDFLNDPRLLQLDIIENKRKDNIEGFYRIQVQPSNLIPNSAFGVVININDHYSVNKQKGKILELDNGVVNILNENWESSKKRAEEIVESIWTKIIQI